MTASSAEGKTVFILEVRQPEISNDWLPWSSFHHPSYEAVMYWKALAEIAYPFSQFRVVEQVSPASMAALDA